MGIDQVEVKEVCLKAAFWPYFQTSFVFLAIAPDNNFVSDIMLH